MECNNIREQVVDYYDHNLTDNIQKEVDRHLGVCSACREEYAKYEHTVSSLKRAVEARQKGVIASNDFENWMQDALKEQERDSEKSTTSEAVLLTDIRSPKRKQNNSWKLALVASVIVAMIGIFAFTPALAAIRDGISNLIDLAMGDRGIISSMEKGFGQEIEKSDINKEIEFTVHSFLSDENRTVALVSASYNGALDEKADNMTLYGMKITDKWGKNVTNGYSSRFKYDSENMRLSGNLDLGKVLTNKKDFVIGFNRAVISKQEIEEVPIKLTGNSMMNLDYRINLETQTIKSLTLENIIISGKMLTIEYNVEYQNEIYMTGGHTLSLIKSNGETHNYSLGSASSRTDTPNTEKIQDMYSIEGVDIVNCRLQLNYAKPLRVIEGKWKVAFRSKDDLAKASTKTIHPDKSFKLGDYELKVSRVVFTPSMTSIHIESTDISPLFVIGNLSLRSGNDIVANSTSGTNTSQLYSTVPALYSASFNFDPVLVPETLSLIIDRARIEGEVDAEIALEPTSKNTVKIVNIDGDEYKLNYKQLPEDIVEISLENLNSLHFNDTEIPDDGLYIVDSNNKKISPTNDGNKYPDNKPINVSDIKVRTYNFAGVEKGKIILHIDSSIKYRKVYNEIKLLD